MKKDPMGGGTNADGTLSQTYCSLCLKNGEYIYETDDVTAFQAHCVQALINKGTPKLMAWAFTRGIPKLERWKVKAGVTIDSIISQLASSTDHNNQIANIELAKSLCQTKDHTAIACLVDILQSGSKSQMKDAIKVLYEVGARRPELIMPYTDVFFDRLDSRDNRIVWGALMALAKISKVSPERVADRLRVILDAADKGSVIAKDQAIEILVSVKSMPDHAQAAGSALFERLRKAAIMQLPKYCEQVAASLLPGEEKEFLSVLDMRLQDHMPLAKRLRLQKTRNAVI